MTIKKITVPDLGEASEVEVIELLVGIGEKVHENETLITKKDVSLFEKDIDFLTNRSVIELKGICSTCKD